ncbi:MAG: hypothetical protein WBA93_02315 [Microcoleaceae cyanobacterium]
MELSRGFSRKSFCDYPCLIDAPTDKQEYTAIKFFRIFQKINVEMFHGKSLQGFEKRDI